MPTAAKLFAAFAMALVAFFTAEIIKPYMPEGTQFGAFTIVCTVIGFICGWRVLGPDVGDGMRAAANAGFKAAVVTFFCGLVVVSVEEMLVLAFRRSYEGPMEAVVGAISIGTELAQISMEYDVLIVLLGGGALAGCLAEWAARRWR
ncbi:MAG: TrgA family protein [Albidovulum sp.]